MWLLIKMDKKTKKKRANARATKSTARWERQQKKINSIKTENGKIIYRLMIAKGVRGDYKDYALVLAHEIIDWQEKWVITGGYDFEKPQLMHKNLLKHLLGDDVAATIWHPQAGRLVTVKPGAKKKEK